MDYLMNLFNINTIFFTIFSYPMSYVEFFGTIFTFWCVWLAARAKILSWPVGLVGSVLYVILFYQIQLYSDFFEQIYFLITGVIGWVAWTSKKDEYDESEKVIRAGMNNWKQNISILFMLVGGTVLLSFVTMNIDAWLPKYFPVPVSFPILDALTTVMSFIAQWLLVKKKFENWILWIAVDIIGIGLYWAKGVKFVSFEYVLFLFMAIWGLWGWIKNYQANRQTYDQKS
jgi:nicotinamide mononucleotide transporter